MYPLFYPDEDDDMDGATSSPRKAATRKANKQDVPIIAVKEEIEDDGLDEDDEENGEDEPPLPEQEDEDALSDVSEEEPDRGSLFFNVNDRMPPFTSKYRPIREIYQMLRSGTVDLDPPYQRESVWKLPRRQGLIDSLFNGRPVMSIFFAVHRREDGTEYRNVLDGKQRLTTLNLFLSGRIPYKDKTNTHGKKFYWKRRLDTPKLDYIVPQKQREFLEEVTIECIEYRGLTMPQEESIFQCIQQGVALTQAEKMRIGDEPGRTFIRELAEERLARPVLENPKLINLKVNNGQDFQNLASFIYCMWALPNDRAHATKKKLDAFLADTKDYSEETKRNIENTLDDFWKIVHEHPQPFMGMKQKVAPVECLFILIYLFITRGLPFEQRAQDILHMRRVVHERHKNQVRSNPRVTHTLWAQIDETVAKYHDIAGTRLPADPLPPYEQSKRKMTKGRKKAILKVEPDSPAVTHDGGAEALAAALNNAQLDQTGYAVSRAQKRGRVTDTFEDAEIDELAFDYDPAPEAGSSERQTPWFARERSAQERQPKRQKVTGDHAGGPLIPSLI